MEKHPSINFESATTKSAPVKQKRALTEADSKFLHDREEAIQNGLRSFLSVGRALLQIHDYEDGLLYKANYGTFQNYCRLRWGIARPRGYELMDAAKTFDSMSAQADKENVKLPLPTNEKQLRHLKSLPTAELQLKAWKDVASRAKPGESIRSEAVAKKVRQMETQHALPTKAKLRRKANGRNHAMTIVAHDKIPLENVRGTRPDEFLNPAGLIYFKIGNFSIEEAIQIFSWWKFSLKRMIAVVPSNSAVDLRKEPVPFDPVLVGTSKSILDVPGSTENVVLPTEQIADWAERLPVEYVQYLRENTRGSHIIRTLEGLIGLKAANNS